MNNSTEKENEFEVLSQQAEKKEGDFVYRLVSEKKVYNENEQIRMYAELMYIGNKEQITIYHAASPFHFPMVENTRGFQIDYSMNQPLLTTTLIKGEALREQYNGSGGYSSEDDQEYINFMKSIMNLHYPIGYYVVDGFANFYVEADDYPKQDFHLKAQIGFKVE